MTPCSICERRLVFLAQQWRDTLTTGMLVYEFYTATLDDKVVPEVRLG